VFALHCKQHQSASRPVMDEVQVLNKAYLPMKFGNSWWRDIDGHTTYYCGRRLGKTAIPESDGQCGPGNGPQCRDCRVAQRELAVFQLSKAVASRGISELRSALQAAADAELPDHEKTEAQTLIDDLLVALVEAPRSRDIARIQSAMSAVDEMNLDNFEEFDNALADMLDKSPVAQLNEYKSLCYKDAAKTEQFNDVIDEYAKRKAVQQLSEAVASRGISELRSALQVAADAKLLEHEKTEAQTLLKDVLVEATTSRDIAMIQSAMSAVEEMNLDNSEQFDKALVDMLDKSPMDIFKEYKSLCYKDAEKTEQFNELIGEYMKRKVMEVKILGAALDRFVVKVALGCSTRIWFKVSMFVLLLRLGLSGIRASLLAILTSILHICVGGYPYVSYLWKTTSLSSGEKRRLYGMVFFMYLAPVWASLVRLMGAGFCESHVFSFSAFGCVDEKELAIGALSEVDSCPTESDLGCAFALGEIIGSVAAAFGVSFALRWYLQKGELEEDMYRRIDDDDDVETPSKATNAQRQHMIEIIAKLVKIFGFERTKAMLEGNEALLLRCNLCGGKGVVGTGDCQGCVGTGITKQANGHLRLVSDFDYYLNQKLWQFGAVEFTLVPWFLILGLNRLINLGSVLLYAIYGAVCFAIMKGADAVAKVHPEIEKDWKARWKTSTKVPMLTCFAPSGFIKLPISDLLVTFVLNIPAFTDNMALSLAIGNVQTIWESDKRLQCLWQKTWQDMPIMNVAMGCISLPVTLGVIMLIGLVMHVSTFLAKIEDNPRAAAEVASLGVFSKLHEVGTLVLAEERAQHDAHAEELVELLAKLKLD